MSSSKVSVKDVKSEPTIEEIYKKKTHHEHILSLPDTYIGSISHDLREMHVYDEETKTIILRDITYPPGLYKICDEIFVNARDHHIRDPTCQNIEISINVKPGWIEVYNDGTGIPVEIHKDAKVYVPEMIFGQLLTGQNYEKKGKIVGGRNGYGSKVCLKKGTMLPTFTGEIKKIEDIKKGEQLIGDDGTPRNVIGITTGTDKLYEITQQNYENESYTVNENHILCLRMPDHKVIFWNQTEQSWTMLWLDQKEIKIKSKKIRVNPQEKILCSDCDGELSSNLRRHYKRKHSDMEVPTKPRKSPTLVAPDTEEAKIKYTEMLRFAETIPDDNTLDISVKEYVKLNDTMKLRLTGYVGECVQWESQEVALDPYVLGLWLGDGMQRGYSFAINADDDPEILEYLEEWGKSNDAKFTQSSCDRIIYNISSLTKSGVAPLKNLLNEYNLVNNKHIPKEYLLNSRDVRLKVLAGFIDSDGYVTREGTRIQIAQGMNHEKLAYELIFLVRSLGLKCCVQKINTQWTYEGELRRGEAIMLNISGEGAQDIPTKVARKKCNSPEKRDTSSTGNLTVKEVEVGDFIGLAVDGNQRFVLEKFTVVHNCNIYSDEFIVETVDSKRKKYYSQHFANNMYTIDPPVIKDVTSKTKPYTKISFKPDYKRFGIATLTTDIIALLKKRVYDLAACTNVNTKLNNIPIKINSFEDYINMYYTKLPSPVIYQEFSERWKIGVLFDKNAGFTQVSFVNGVCTYQGGSHITHVVDQICTHLITYIKEKHKGLTVKSSHIKENMTIFIDCVIEDPTFSSQTKEFLTSKINDFGSRCEISPDFIKRLLKTGLIDEVIKLAEFKQMGELVKTDFKKTNKVSQIEKLDDAQWAGKPRKSQFCHLILTEGDSAKTFAVDGLDIIGRERYGVFPLRGKLLNVREATVSQLMKNTEFINLKQILGLKQNRKYTDTKKLRYGGGIIILTDQDVDGSHIKGLIINMFDKFWPSLLKIPNFIQCLTTPILKAFKKSDTKKLNPEIFYTISQYKTWVDQTLGGDSSGWNIKYYKGLGTSTDKESKAVFSDFNNRLTKYVWETANNVDIDPKTATGDDINKLNNQSDDQIIDDDVSTQDNNKDDQDTEIDATDAEDASDDIEDEIYENSPSRIAIKLAFERALANNRKNWLFAYNKDDILDTTKQNVTYSDFINKELKHFSTYSNHRMIPKLTDGLKPSQRKILFAAFKKKLENNEMKVAQFGAYAAETTEYIHGESSLFGAIINMAQTFTGANNINLLTPNGNFGNRRCGGKDAASPRYIFTQINKLTSLMFRKEDESIYVYNEEDGTVVEPETYYPILPVVLINGVDGIGTGFSTFIPQFNPLDIVNNLKIMMDDKEPNEMLPWFRGFTGAVTDIGKGRIQTSGIYEIINENTVRVTELPIGFWTEDFKQHLDDVTVSNKEPTEKQFIESFVNNSGNNTIDFMITFAGNKLQEAIKTGTLEKKLKLTTSVSMNNMYLFNSKGVMTKYITIDDILIEFYKTRLNVYKKRKEHYIRVLENELNILREKKRFIQYVLIEKIPIKFREEADVEKDLIKHGFKELAYDVNSDKPSYGYLTNMRLWSITKTQIDILEKECEKKEQELNNYMNKTIKQLWTEELDAFVAEYNKFLVEMANPDDKTKKTKKGKTSQKSEASTSTMSVSTSTKSTKIVKGKKASASS